MIVATLDNLSHTIRIEMQEYHPTLLKTLTLKENYHNLLKMIQKNMKQNMLIYPLHITTTYF